MEFRLNDRIYEHASMPAPMNAYKIIFFRFWKPTIVDGILIGQDRLDATRKAKMDLAFLALYSGNFCETDIRSNLEALASEFGISLADVYPYQGTKGDAKRLSKVVLTDGQTSPVTRIKRGMRKSFDFHFNNRPRVETDYFINFWNTHYPSVPFIYRDYDFIPPVDTVIDIPVPSEPEISLAGAVPNRFNYSFTGFESSD